jgi:hypothetical protein
MVYLSILYDSFPKQTAALNVINQLVLIMELQRAPETRSVSVIMCKKRMFTDYSLDNSSNSNANNDHQAENKNSQCVKLVIVTQIYDNTLVYIFLHK